MDKNKSYKDLNPRCCRYFDIVLYVKPSYIRFIFALGMLALLIVIDVVYCALILNA